VKRVKTATNHVLVRINHVFSSLYYVLLWNRHPLPIGTPPVSQLFDVLQPSYFTYSRFERLVLGACLLCCYSHIPMFSVVNYPGPGLTVTLYERHRTISPLKIPLGGYPLHSPQSTMVAVGFFDIALLAAVSSTSMQLATVISSCTAPNTVALTFVSVFLSFF
jgi:hypothetical protein